MMIFTVYRANGSTDAFNIPAGDSDSEEWLDNMQIEVSIIEEEFWNFTLVAQHAWGIAATNCQGSTLASGLSCLVGQIKSQQAQAAKSELAPLPI